MDGAWQAVIHSLHHVVFILSARCSFSMWKIIAYQWQESGFQADFCNYSHWGPVNRIKKQILDLSIPDEVSTLSSGSTISASCAFPFALQSIDINMTQVFERAYGNRLALLWIKPWIKYSVHLQ